MRAAIETKYVGPTNTKGARIAVYYGHAARKFYPWDHGLDIEDNHKEAARKFLESRGLHEKFDLAGGFTTTGYAFILVQKGCGNA